MLTSSTGINYGLNEQEDLTKIAHLQYRPR